MLRKLCQHDYTLRNYQQEAKEKIFDHWDYANGLLYQMPTGTGKTRLFTSIIRDLSVAGRLNNKPYHILIIAHRTELIEQTSESLTRYRVPHGIIAGAFPNKRDSTQYVQVASIQTITHPSNLKTAVAFNPSFIIIDEAHHALAQSYVTLWNLFPDAKKLGVTATPWRMDGRGFTHLFEKFIPSMSINEFIREGWLASYEYYSISMDNTIIRSIDNIKEFGYDGDYQVEALERIMSSREIRSQLLDSYLSLAKGKKGIIYSVSQFHSKLICENYRDAGVKIAEINGSTPLRTRKALVEDFKNNLIDVIVNVDIFSEGFDCPSIEFVQLARPTRSLVKYLQQIGRGLRLNGDKRCVIIDNVGLYANFGLPNADRDWLAHFNGTAKKYTDDRESQRKVFRNISLNEGRQRNLSEGNEDIILIQSDHNCEAKKTSDNTDTAASSQSQEIVVSPQEETYSDKIFAKYHIVTCSSGFYIENTRTNMRQILKPRLELSDIYKHIKIIKSAGALKGFSLYCSYSTCKNLEKYDIPLGMLYREGKILKFRGSDKNDVVFNVNI